MPLSIPHSRPFLSLSDATFRLGDRLVFQHTSWILQDHEQWAVTGSNGSGKSLFGDALRGRLPLIGGELHYHFAGLHNLTAEDCIGHVSFQDRKAGLHGEVVQSRWNSAEENPARTVKDFLSYEQAMSINPFEISDLHQKERPAFDRRSQRAIKLLDIGRFRDRDLLSLSNGETQRIHLARALSLPLQFLILDEPFLGLDTVGRHYFRSVLETLMRAGLRVLLITTQLNDLPQTVTHLLHLKDCQVVAAAERRDLLKLLAANRLSGSPITARTRRKRRSEAIHRGERLRLCSPATRRPLVQLRDVRVRYDQAAILDGVTWTIYPGESWALVGPNGSGKTTLLSLILGDNPQAYQNDITLFGRRFGSGSSIWELKKQIGWVSPELHLHFDESITCFDAVASGFHNTIGLFDPVTGRQRKNALEWLERFGLRSSADVPLFALSAGLQRMVLLARALVKRPRLLILDEPCQGLDSAHRALFLRSVDALLRSGKETAIYVTHRAEEIPRSIHLLLRLEEGKSAHSTV